jgi:hypothetical protein
MKNEARKTYLQKKFTVNRVNAVLQESSSNIFKLLHSRFIKTTPKQKSRFPEFLTRRTIIKKTAVPTILFDEGVTQTICLYIYIYIYIYHDGY